MNTYDVILAGGGLANALLAWRLRTHQPELRILLLEQGEAIGGNHTWSFHDGDLTGDERAWLAPVVGTHWPRYDVVFPEYARTLDSGYASIASGDFARVVEPVLGDALRLRARIDAVTPTTVRLANGDVLAAGAVIDGRGMLASPHLALGWQTFVGQEVRLHAPHGLAHPVLMDAGVAQQGGYRFVYLLPFAPDRLLIEDTHYVDNAGCDVDRLRGNIAAYAQQRGWRIADVLREEQGALPIVLAGDVERYWDDLAGQPCSGLRAGLFHPTTGYSLPHAVRMAGLVAGLPDLSAPALFATLREAARQEWRRQGFFRLLNRMLFLAGAPDSRWRVMQRFYRLPPGLVARFYAGRPTGFDVARILTGKPPVPVGQALDAAVRTHPRHIGTSVRTTP